MDWGAILFYNRAGTFCDLIQRCVPRNRFKVSLPFLSDSTLREQESIILFLALRVACHLDACKPLSHRMGGIACKLSDAIAFDRDM